MKVFLQESVQLLLLQRGQGIDLWRLRLCSGDQFDSMIPFVVLWQYVKVLLGEHGLELCDVGRQRSGSGKCLLTASGSLHKTLGGCSCSSEVNLSKFREDVCKEQLVSEPPVRAAHLQRHFFEL